jgi:NAD(P)H-quinone oxidoreductase subunit 5
VALALVAGPMGKCAQFPLHLWLDEAMEGPMPSTILRNSVVVATGAWVLIKLAPVLALSPIALAAMIFIGAVTALGGSLIAIAQIDAKRALSYSVSAYMGLVFIAVGTQQTEAALLLTLTHAVASALLVMGVGAVVWNSITQDLTQLGGLWSRRPISGLSVLVGMAGLIALPPFGGFWALLEMADGLWETQPWLVILMLMVNGITAFGLTRVFSLIYGGEAKQMAQRSPEIHWLMALPMMILLGFVLHLPLVLQSLSLLPAWADLNTDVALLLIWSSLSGLSLGAIVYLGKTIAKPVKLPWQGLQDLFAYDFYTPKLYRTTIVFSVDLVSRITYWIDRYLVDATVNLFGIAALISGQTLKYITSGQTQFYALTIVASVVLVGFAMMWMA